MKARRREHHDGRDSQDVGGGGRPHLLGEEHGAFFAAIDEPLEHEDPSDRLFDVETQLRWLRELGFDDVDCYWKWLEIALLVGVKPAAVG